MIKPQSNVALVIGHPGHELRVYRFMELYQPIVFVLTDGSGSKGQTRLERTRQIIRNTGSKEGAVLGRFSDKEIYDLILNKKQIIFYELARELAAAFNHHNINAVVGDSNEGFSPTHDLCNYLIKAAARIYGRQKNRDPEIFEFYLESSPTAFPEDKQHDLLTIPLDEQAFERKYQAALGYPELAFELNRFIGRFGKKPFQTEFLWQVSTDFKPCGWKNPIPEYESSGRKRVDEGVYDAAITYEEHMLPLAEYLYHESALH